MSSPCQSAKKRIASLDEQGLVSTHQYFELLDDADVLIVPGGPQRVAIDAVIWSAVFVARCRHQGGSISVAAHAPDAFKGDQQRGSDEVNCVLMECFVAFNWFSSSTR